MFKNKVLPLFILVLLFVMFSGCASLNSSIPFQYQPSLISLTQTINKTVGLNMLIDKRPEGDVAYTKSIKDLSEKVTAKLLEDFNKSNLFKEIHYPAQPGDDIVINGTVDRFMWKMYMTAIGYIPLINMFVYFGAPCYESYGVAGITLEIKDNKTGKIIGTLSESSKIETSYTIYNFKAGEAGTELQEAFRDVAKKLKEDLLRKVSF
jgi:hypothetical protein